MMIFFPSPIIRAIILAICLIIPAQSQAVQPGSVSEISSEVLTLNYSLAVRGGYPNIVATKQSPASEAGKTAQPAISQNLYAQTSSTVEESYKQKSVPNTSFFTIDEEVPSYIIHEPTSRHTEDNPETVTNSPQPPFEEPQPGDQMADASPESIVDIIPNVPSTGRFRSNSIIDWSFQGLSRVLPAFFTTSLHLPFDPSIEPSDPQTYLVRFGHVLDPNWEPSTSAHSSEYGTIPLVINDAVAKNLRYFQKGIPDRFQSYLDRFHHYKEVVEPIFREFGIPTELMYLSLVESGFNPKAFSRARASGPWQFMKATGRMYKLNVNWYIDERRDPIKSTVAAAHHLRDLYDRFGSWPLALAAYNAGSGKISRAIRKTKTRDFWKIRRTWYIRRETKDYVPRFIAATLIAKDPTAYGFLAPEGDGHHFEEVLISKQVQLSAVTKQTGISLEELKRLNPELRRNIVPATKGPGYHLKVPVGMASVVSAQHASFPVWTQPPPPSTQWYRVRRGDSLSVVARRFGMKVRQLKRMNNLSGNLIRIGTRLRVRGWDDDYADDKTITYRVRYGDSLGKIARRFRTSVRHIKRLNNLSTHLIYPGDRLRVRGTSPSKKSGGNNSKWYRVRRGDSLWSIARQFRMSVRDLRALNNLSSSIIRAGHMLMVSH